MAADTHVYPSFSEYRKLASKGTLVPVYREMVADLETPVSAFLKVASGESAAFLLESVEQGEKLGRYSFIGYRPSVVIEGRADEDVARVVQARMGEFKLVRVAGLPSFCGGFVGYLGYENVQFFEKVRLRAKRDLGVPGGVFFLTDRFLVFDQVERTLKMVALCAPREGLRRSYDKGVAIIEEMNRALVRRTPQSPTLDFMPRADHRSLLKSGMTGLKPNMTKGQFEDRVRKIKRFIHQGDCIQVVYSQRFDLGKIDHDFDVYRALRVINPSPYMFFFRYKDLSLIGSSPEVLVKKTGKKAEIRPIAGTRRRGHTDEEDAMLESELKHSAKELAEHLMLVDLGRNDLGRICEYRTVGVRDYARVERYSHVMHLVSEVAGELRRGEDAFSLLRAAFPAGTVSGAPKIRAMEIIDEMEDEARGPYAGCLGYFSFSGDMDMCIMIRTIVVKSGRASVQAGAGIVYDSEPSHEYQETVNKAKALFEAVNLAGKA